MANPRKFSEKIALHNHRQAEETARFEQIMREVSDATARVAPERNVTNQQHREQQTLRLSPQSLGAFRGGSLPNVSAAAPKAANTTKGDEITGHHVGSSSNNATGYRTGSRSRTPGGPMRRPHDRRLDTSPYSSGPFLSPPDTSWRRTNSDSALHHSTMQGMNSERSDSSGSRWMIQSMNGSDPNDGRPRSSCEVPRVPGIHIHPIAHVPGTIQIPIQNNTGSLPDLTNVNVDFSSPIHAPLDQDHDQGSSPYSSSPVNTSPSTLSPTNIQQGGPRQGRFHFTPVSHSQSNHLSVPVNSRYQQHNFKNVQLDNSSSGLLDGDYSQYTTQSIYQPQCSPTSNSPTSQQQQGGNAGYRSPRPSPQSSPSLGGRHSAPCSPGGAPSPLPGDYQMFNHHQASQFQQHFEQLSMDWAQLVASLLESGCTWSAQLQLDPPVNSTVSGYHTLESVVSPQQSLPQEVPSSGAELTCSDPGYYSTSPSQLVYPTASVGLHTTPNTPTSIPDIILTDFSSAGDDRQDLTKQLESDFFSDETLREGLGSIGSIDYDELQMLSDPGMNLITDSVEDHFRLDRTSLPDKECDIALSTSPHEAFADCPEQVPGTTDTNVCV